MHLYCTLVGRPWSALYSYSPFGAGQPRRDGGGRSEAGSLAGGGGLQKGNGGVHAAPQYPAGAMRAVPGSRAHPPGWGGESRRP